MNKIYRVVWCHVRNTYVVASELASCKKVKSSRSVGIKKKFILTGALSFLIMATSIAYSEEIIVLNDKNEIVLNQNLFEDREDVSFVLGIGAINNTGDRGGVSDSIILGNGAKISSELEYPEDDNDSSSGMIAIGNNTFAEEKKAIAFGDSSSVRGTLSTAIGGNTKVVGSYSTAIGGGAVADQNSSVAIGAISYAAGDSSTAIGMGSHSQGALSIAIGRGSKSEAGAYGSVAIGTDSIVEEKYTVSFGRDQIEPVGNDDGSAINRRLTHVDKGRIEEFSVDAINGSQLFGTNQSIVDSLGGGAKLNDDGTITGPSYDLGEVDEDGNSIVYDNVGDALTNIDGRVDENTTNITNITQGSVGLVKLDDDRIVIDNDLAKGADTFDFANGVDSEGKTVTRKLTGVSEGLISAESTDAINGSQLYGTNQSIVDSLGGGAKLNDDGTITGPSYDLGEVDEDGNSIVYDNVGDALTNIDGRVDENTTNINKIKNGQVGLIKLSGDRIVIDNNLSGVQNAMTFDFASNGADPRTLTGVAKGQVSKDSVDAVNGSQLFETNQKIENITNLNGQNLEGIAEAMGGGAKVEDGLLTGVDFAGALKSDEPITNVYDGFGHVTGRLDGHDTKLENHENRITTIEGDINNIAGGKAGLIQLSEDGKSLVVDNGLAKDANTFDISKGEEGQGKEGRTLTGVNDGQIASTSKDAINGSQLFATNQSIANMFGGGATVDKDGYVSTPEYNFGDNNVFNNVGDSLTYLNNKVQEHGIFSLDREKNQIIIADNKDINKETVVNMGNRKIVGVANGKVEKGSQEAVNGGQLWETNQQVASNTNQIKHINNTLSHYNNRINNLEKKVHQNRKVASAGIAGAMAMSSIPYIDYAKYSIGMGVASYDGEHALSLGFEFKMSENGRFRIQGSYDSQSKVGVGVGMAFEL